MRQDLNLRPLRPESPKQLITFDLQCVNEIEISAEICGLCFIFHEVALGIGTS